MRHRSGKTAVEKDGEESERLNVAAHDFVITELDLAETFCAVGNNAGSPQTAERNQERARRALGTAVRALRYVPMSEQQCANVLRRVARIQNLLNNIGPRRIAAWTQRKVKLPSDSVAAF
jgi:hypothetical protein